MNNYLERALDLASKGFTPIPLNGKKPVTEGWQNLRNLKAEQLYEWNNAGLWRNIGMVCGAASNNVVVIDFDGLAGYELFKTKFPEYVNTLTVATGSGAGMHCYFKVGLLPDSKGYMDIPLEGGELVNIEIKSDGKQVVIPPSIHPDTGKAYEKHLNVAIMQLDDLTAIMNWAASLKPQERKEWAPPTMSRAGEEFNPKLTAAVESYFMAQSHNQHREWINCQCPNGSQHKHGDAEWSFGYNTQKFFGWCYGCGNDKPILLKDLLPLIGIDPVSYGGWFETQTSPTTQKTNANYSENNSSNPVQNIQPVLRVVTRRSRLTHYLDQLVDMDALADHPPVPFPLRALHEFGGMTRVIKPGKLIGLVGVSGGGKTSLIETMVDGWLCYNVPCLVWSPEWEGDEFVDRAVQRYGGPTTEEVYLHQIYKQEVKDGIVSGGAGVPITRQLVAQAEDALEILKGWSEEVGYIDEPLLTIGQLQAQIEATLKALTFKPRVLAIDYAQLLHAVETNREVTMYNLLMRIKAICRVYGLVGLVASQVTKAGTKDAQGGDLLDGLAARYVNDDAFNLFITINPDREMTVKDGRKIATGRFLPSAVLNITKSSMGRKGKMRLAVDWERLMFSDERHMNQNFTGEFEDDEDGDNDDD